MNPPKPRLIPPAPEITQEMIASNRREVEKDVTEEYLSSCSPAGVGTVSDDEISFTFSELYCLLHAALAITPCAPGNVSLKIYRDRDGPDSGLSFRVVSHEYETDYEVRKRLLESERSGRRNRTYKLEQYNRLKKELGL